MHICFEKYTALKKIRLTRAFCAKVQDSCNLH